MTEAELCLKEVFELLEVYSKEIESIYPPHIFKGLRREAIKLVRECIRDLSNLKAKLIGIESLLNILRDVTRAEGELNLGLRDDEHARC